MLGSSRRGEVRGPAEPSSWPGGQRARRRTDHPLRGRVRGRPDTGGGRAVQPVADTSGGRAHPRRCDHRAAGARPDRPGRDRTARERRPGVPVSPGGLRARTGGLQAAGRQARADRVAGHGGVVPRGGRGARGPRRRARLRAGRDRPDHDRPRNAVADPARQQHAGRAVPSVRARRGGGRGAPADRGDRDLPRLARQLRRTDLTARDGSPRAAAESGPQAESRRPDRPDPVGG